MKNVISFPYVKVVDNRKKRRFYCMKCQKIFAATRDQCKVFIDPFIKNDRYFQARCPECGEWTCREEDVCS